MAQSPKLLFDEARLSDVLERQKRELVREVEHMPEEHLLSADVEAWVAALVEKYKANAPVLNPDGWWMDDPVETRIDVSGDYRRAVFDRSRPAMHPGFEVRVHIPFAGDQAVFSLQPSTFTFNPPQAIVGKDEIVHVLRYPYDAPPDIQASSEKLIAEVTKYLDYARRDIEVYNDGLADVARAAIVRRRERVEANRAHVAQSGIPIGPPGKTKQRVIEDAIVRRPTPVLPPTRTRAPPITLDPVLEESVFEHVLSVIRSVGIDMERAPTAYAAMDEEARRQVIVLALNSHYRGKTTAEAFNMSGRTDILVRHEDRNLFVGECKFWEGQKAFAEAIDQLFSYRTWRDTKLSLIVFVREKSPRPIVKKGRGSLEAHSQFVALKAAASDTELRAVVSWPRDEGRHADLNVFFFHTPV